MVVDTLRVDILQDILTDSHHLTEHLRLSMAHPVTKATALLESISEEFVKDIRSLSTSKNLTDILKEDTHHQSAHHTALHQSVHHTALHPAAMASLTKIPLREKFLLNSF